MKALVLGCGEMGQVAIRDLVAHGVFTEVAIGCRKPARAEPFLSGLPQYHTRISLYELDVQNTPALVQRMKAFDVVCNLAGPNFRNAVPAARAAIAAGVPLVDVSDDWAETLELLDLHEDALRADTTIVVGLGASPGVTNVLARYGADRLDRTDEVHTAWIMRGSDLGGPALSAHLLHSLPHRAFVFEDARMREVRPFVDGKETFDFPELGPVEVMHIGHPEPLTLSRYIEGIRYADDKATFLPDGLNELIVQLGKIACSGIEVRVGDRCIDPEAFATRFLFEWGKQLVDEPRTGALRTEVRGELEGRKARLVYTASGRIGIGTGVPAAIGAQLLAIGKLQKPGVYPPEACIDPEWFLAAVDARNIGEVSEELIYE